MKNLTHIASLTCALALTACGGGGSDSPASAPTPPVPEATQSITIQFAAVAGPGNTPVGCGSVITGLGSVPTDAQLADLRFYVSNVVLLNDKGEAVLLTLDENEWQHTSGIDAVALIDLENGQGACAAEGTAATNAVIRGKVPVGSYVGVVASVSVPEKLSHSDVSSAAAPLDIMAMGWSWQAGRKFAKIELNPVGGVTTTTADGTSSVATYNLHLASTDCTGKNDGNDTCAKKNVAFFTVPLNPATQQVAIDVAELFGSTDIRTNQGGAVGCMSAISDPDFVTRFEKVGLNLMTGELAASQPSIFRAIAR